MSFAYTSNFTTAYVNAYWQPTQVASAAPPLRVRQGGDCVHQWEADSDKRLVCAKCDCIRR